MLSADGRREAEVALLRGLPRESLDMEDGLRRALASLSRSLSLLPLLLPEEEPLWWSWSCGCRMPSRRMRSLMSRS